MKKNYLFITMLLLFCLFLTACKGVGQAAAPTENASPGMSTAQKPENSKYLSLTEAAKISGITRQAISKYSAKGAFPIVKAGGKARIPRAEFNAWLVGSKT